MSNSYSRQETSLQVAREIDVIQKSRLDLDQTTQRIVNLISESFGFYFVGLFLVNRRKQWVDFYAGTGEIGRLLREKGYRFGASTRGMMSISFSQNKVCIDDFLSSGGFLAVSLPPDMEIASIPVAEFVEDRYRPSPLLPETKSQMIIPLRVPQGVIGVIDIHSRTQDDFDQKDISTFLPLADKIAFLCDGLMRTVPD